MKKWITTEVFKCWIVFSLFLGDISVCTTSPIQQLVNASTPTVSTRIVGGKPADIQNYPYQLSMQYRGQHICGASIISSQFVVTAAHCTYRTISSRITFRGGSSTRSQGGQLVKAKTVYQHPKFNFDVVDYDVAVVEVTPKFAYNARLKNIAIGNGEPKEGTSVTASGWGTTRETNNRIPSELRAVEVPVVNRSNCQKAYSRQATITNRMICAGALHRDGKDTCQGDSGGPLVSRGRLVGVVSWGIGCGRLKYPGVYTNLNNREIRSYVKRISGV